MKKTIMTLVIISMALSLWAGQRGETKVDSIIYDQGMQWKTFPSEKAVKAFALQKDVLWIATETGLHSMNMTKGSDKKDLAAIGALAVTDVTALAVCSMGNLWIGTPNGCAVKMKDGDKIYTKDNGLADNAVNAILSAKGKVWVGTNGGACLFQSGSWTKYTADQGLCGNKVRCMALDKHQTVWFGTDKGISSFDGSKWKKYTMDDGMSWNDTKVIGCDPRTNIVWAAVGEKDMNSFDGTGKWKTFMDIADGIRSIMIDSQSRVWIGTSAGLVKFNGEEWVNDQTKIGIPANQVSQMYCDEKGNLWFGMEKGVMRVGNPYPY
jgi:ligand-binding sensor domain-containing protein